MTRRAASLLSGGVLVGWLTALSVTAAQADTFYKWTDEKGVVHFSDAPPPNAKGVEERNLIPPAAPAQPVPPQAPAPGESGATPGEAQAAVPPQAAATEGPARVILVSRDTPRTGPSAIHVIGEVKNVGGADASNVAVTIRAVDATQGTPCLQQDVAVTPSTLHPGESGHFDANVESPCLYGNPPLDVSPGWD